MTVVANELHPKAINAPDAQRLALELLNEKNVGVLELEAVAQILEDTTQQGSAEWEGLVATAVTVKESHDNVKSRVRSLAEIPFRAVLTTNFDHVLDGVYVDEQQLGPRMYARVLRRQDGWWSAADWSAPTERLSVPIVRLHGWATGSVDRHAVVLSRASYRKKLYGDPQYLTFLRSTFAQYTLLFLGVSFTDAYLNELRSEVLSMLRDDNSDGQPWAYALMADAPEGLVQFMRRHEGIEVTAYQTTGQGHAPFDNWLESLASETSPRGRIRRLLDGKRIVWVDANHANNNSYGLKVFGKAVVKLEGPGQLVPELHRDAAVLITRFGYRRGNWGSGSTPVEADALELLTQVDAWPDRPPVIVFADPDPTHLDENRRQLLRRGAFEYTSQWPEFFQALERLLRSHSGWPGPRPDA